MYRERAPKRRPIGRHRLPAYICNNDMTPLPLASGSRGKRNPQITQPTPRTELQTTASRSGITVQDVMSGPNQAGQGAMPASPFTSGERGLPGKTDQLGANKQTKPWYKTTQTTCDGIHDGGVLWPADMMKSNLHPVSKYRNRSSRRQHGSQSESVDGTDLEQQ